jgi:hypothetical protein
MLTVVYCELLAIAMISSVQKTRHSYAPDWRA